MSDKSECTALPHEGCMPPRWERIKLGLNMRGYGCLSSPIFMWSC